MGGGPGDDAGKSRGRLQPGDTTEDGWTVLEGGWYGRGPVDGHEQLSPDRGWRVVRPPDHEGDGLASWLVEHWPELTADLLQLYGVDVGDDALMRSRPWSWLDSLIAQTFTVRSRLLWARHTSDEQGKVREMMSAGGTPLPWQ